MPRGRKPREKTTVYTPPDQRKAAGTKKAIKALNREIGIKSYRAVSKRSKADVVVKSNLKNPKFEGLTYGVAKEHGKKPARIRLAPGASTRTVEHELGHSKGLAHKEVQFGEYDKKTQKWTTTANRNNLMAVGGIGGKKTNLSPGQKAKLSGRKPKKTAKPRKYNPEK